MHIYDQPNGEKVICAGGQDGDIVLAFYDKGIYTYISLGLITCLKGI